MNPSLKQVFEAAYMISEMRRLGVVFKKGSPREVNGVRCGNQSPSMDQIEARFWSKVDKFGPVPNTEKYPDIGTPCWIWTGPRDGNGYGAAIINKFRFSAHRVAFALEFGDFLDGMQACHHCDNPICVNPGHLFPGTNRDNHMDCVRKGRGNLRVLSTDQVIEIRRSSKSCSKLSREMGVCAESIRWAAIGQTYQEVDEPTRSFVTRKLDPDKVRHIRSSDKRNVEIARELGITEVLVSQVRLRKSWRNVP